MPLANLGALVPGGIPQGTAALLTGPPGAGKSTFALQLLTDHLSAGGQAILVTTEASPTQLFERAALLGMALRTFSGDGLSFIDCYSWRAGKPSAEPHVVTVASLTDLSSISIKLGEALEASRSRAPRPLLVLFDSPSTLTLHAGSQGVLKLLEVVLARVKAAGGGLLVPIEKDMHDEAFCATLAAMADGVLQFRVVEEKDDLVRQMRVASMRTARAASAKWARLALKPDGCGLDVPGEGATTVT